jgi:predicted aldo/keto reductase-like oxidoreductase
LGVCAFDEGSSIDEERSIAMIRSAIEQGMNYFDMRISITVEKVKLCLERLWRAVTGKE